MRIHELFRASDAEDRIARELAVGVPQLNISSDWRPTVPSAVSSGEPSLLTPGYAVLSEAVETNSSAKLRAGIEHLVANELPAVFIYMFDEVWELGEALRARLSAALGVSYHLLEDVWAWSVKPGKSGWPAHRGEPHLLLDRMRPQLLNVWVALSDVEVDRACMHVVPLDDDPSYPAHLDRTNIPPATATPLSSIAGTAFVWNGNLLHWGGACSPKAAGPRVSCSFSLMRDDSRLPRLKSLSYGERFDLRARLDVIAQQIMTYGESEPEMATEVREWARATCTLRALMHQRA